MQRPLLHLGIWPQSSSIDFDSLLDISHYHLPSSPDICWYYLLLPSLDTISCTANSLCCSMQCVPVLFPRAFSCHHLLPPSFAAISNAAVSLLCLPLQSLATIFHYHLSVHSLFLPLAALMLISNSAFKYLLILKIDLSSDYSRTVFN